jgi:hypothetical protein
LHERDERLTKPPRAEEVHLQRLPHHVEVRVHATLAPIHTDTGVVDQDVEPPELLLDVAGQLGYALLVGHVELPDAYVALYPLRSGASLLLIARAEDRRDASFGELAHDLTPDAPVSSTDQRNPPILHYLPSYSMILGFREG